MSFRPKTDSASRLWPRVPEGRIASDGGVEIPPQPRGRTHMALIREAPGTGIDTRELRRAACSVPRHCHRINIHGAPRENDCAVGQFPGCFRRGVSQMPSQFHLRGSGGLGLVFCYTKLGQGVVMLHSVRQDVKSHCNLSTYGRCCRMKA
jgi:hypothetical protein